MARCGEGGHHYFCAEVIAIESLGKVVVIAICTSCGDILAPEIQVSVPGSPLTLLKTNTKDKQT